MNKSAPTPGEMARDALVRDERALLPPCGPAGVRVPLRVEPAADGMANLVHTATGAVMGKCSSEEVANRTRDFLQ